MSAFRRSFDEPRAGALVTIDATASARIFARYCEDALDRLYLEGASRPRMMSIGFHLRIIGRAGRIAGLKRLLADIARHDGA